MRANRKRCKFFQTSTVKSSYSQTANCQRPHHRNRSHHREWRRVGKGLSKGEKLESETFGVTRPWEDTLWRQQLHTHRSAHRNKAVAVTQRETVLAPLRSEVRCFWNVFAPTGEWRFSSHHKGRDFRFETTNSTVVSPHATPPMILLTVQLCYCLYRIWSPKIVS